MDPQKYRGTVYLASNWIQLGLSKGYARSREVPDQARSKKVTAGTTLRANSVPQAAGVGLAGRWMCATARWICRLAAEQLEDRGGRRGDAGSGMRSGAAGAGDSRASREGGGSVLEDRVTGTGSRWDERERRCMTPSDTTFQRVMEGRTRPRWNA